MAALPVFSGSERADPRGNQSVPFHQPARGRWLRLGLILGLGVVAAAILSGGYSHIGFSWVVERFAGQNRPAEDMETAAAARLAGLADALPLSDCRIVVHKADRSLLLYSDTTLVKSYRIGLGGAPAGRKEREGDRRTPEGEYAICTRTRTTPFHLFLGLNYPNTSDARAALLAGTITRATLDQIAAAEREHRQPSWETPLGGAIGLHGLGSFGDWTLGCIALDNAAIEELWVATALWTPVEIKP